MTTSSEKEFYKTPRLSGEDEDWPIFKKKFESILARVGVERMLLEETSRDLKPDNYVVTTADDEDAIKALQKDNRKAAGLLLNAIDDTTDKGKAMFFLIEKYHNADSGFAGGQFYKEWKTLINRFESIQTKTLREYKSEYQSKKMGELEQPSLFISDMERLRIEIKKKNANHEIVDDAFMQDMLSKIPESRNRKMMTPCQVERRFIVIGSTNKYYG